MEAEFRRKVRENEACLAQQLRAELPEDARQALLDRERLQLELTQLQESIGSGWFKGLRGLGFSGLLDRERLHWELTQLQESIGSGGRACLAGVLFDIQNFLGNSRVC
jgi:hypothetical protein